MRSLEHSKQRWQLITRHAATLNSLKEAVNLNEDNPCKSGLRSVCWKAILSFSTFLLFQSTESTRWSQALENTRSAYTSLRDHYLRYIENPDELGTLIDPLDDDQSSPWKTVRQDEEIRAEIFQDVERCMPEDPYFRKPEIQRVLLDILFVFCKINQDVGYRQGMHELLAPILWVVEQDAIDYGSQGRKGELSSESLVEIMLDPNYIEHDTFTLFSLVMRAAKSSYELGEPELKTDTTSPEAGRIQNGASPIVERSKRIHEVYLACLDPALSKHLTEIEILPQIFLIRWIRLLCGREFPFQELLQMWDVLFAEDPDLNLVDLVCVAMLLRIRWQLIEADYSTALMLLLKYPSPQASAGPWTFVMDAIYLRDNFSAASGAEIIARYGEKPPPPFHGSLPSTPSVSPKRGLASNKSPLPSPGRLLQQQGGVEALLHGAAKGMFDRAERLGINQAVRDAVEEAKRNMQGLQTPRSNPSNRRTADLVRWSLDEGRSVPTIKAKLIGMSTRNKQLAKMLDQAMSELRAASNSQDESKEHYITAMDVAIAKVDFVKIYLEDDTMPLPDDAQNESSAASQPPEQSPRISRAEDKVVLSTKGPMPPRQLSPEKALMESTPPEDTEDTERPKATQVESTSSESLSAVDVPDTTTDLIGATVTPRPKAPVPTRSSIAQSSFSWMLEPDRPTSSPHKSSSSSPSSPFLKSSRRPMPGPNREKAAFLFGDEDGEQSTSKASLPFFDESDQVFNLGTMKGSPTK